MMSNFWVFCLLAAAAICSLVSADSREEGRIPRLLPLSVVRHAAPSRAVYKIRGGSGSDESYGPARYQFAYQVRATGGGKGAGYGGRGGGSDSDERRGGGGGYGGYGGGRGASAEFGHAETRDGYKTTGKYFVQQPDGRLRTVDYAVDGDSGFVAKVTYDGESDERRRVVYRRRK